MPNFRHRLSKGQQREYDSSNAVRTVAVRVSLRGARAAQLLEWALAHGDRPRTQRVAQAICDELCDALRVPKLRVEVKAVRPSDRRGELHGLYESAGPAQVISVWMFTAKRGQVVAYRTFLRTLIHEMCHHLDYQSLKLRDSFHTDGFFQRESSLVRQLLAVATRAAAQGPAAAAAPASARSPTEPERTSARWESVAARPRPTRW